MCGTDHLERSLVQVKLDTIGNLVPVKVQQVADIHNKAITTQEG